MYLELQSIKNVTLNIFVADNKESRYVNLIKKILRQLNISFILINLI